jgi:acetyl esterase/lipase
MTRKGAITILQVAIGILIGLGLSGPARAMSEETAAAEAQIRAIGHRWDGEVLQKTQPLFVPLLKKVSRADIAAAKDLAYGGDPKQKLDIYAPAKAVRGRPVVVYVHGGGLSGGDKDSPNTDGLINSNVPVYFAHHGMIGVNLNYRLVPGIRYPAGGEDLASAVTWLHANVAHYGGNPNAIFVIGHSAGGYHLGTYLYDGKVNGNAPRIAGAIFLSGVIELDREGPRVEVTRQYYGDDASKWPALDPYARIDSYKGKRVPTFLINAEFDSNDIELQGGVRHYAKLCTLDKACPRYYQAQNMNHLSTALSLGTDDDSLGRELRDFIQRTRAPKAAVKTAQGQ